MYNSNEKEHEKMAQVTPVTNHGPSRPSGGGYAVLAAP